MLLRHGLGLAQPADAVEAAVRAALAGGARTKDIAAPGEPVLGTRAMGDRIVDLVGSAALEIRHGSEARARDQARALREHPSRVLRRGGLAAGTAPRQHAIRH